jgi:hypothetical protein
MAFIEVQRGYMPIRGFLGGLPSSGKTFTGLSLLSHLAAEGDPELVRPEPSVPGGFIFSRKLSRLVAVIESENRSREYAGGRPFWYSGEELNTFGPGEWIAALREARRRGFRAVLLDSLTDEWRGRGGCLSQAEEKGGKYSDWKPVKELHWKLIEEIQAYPGHVLATLRSKPGIVVKVPEGEKRAKVEKTPPEPIQEAEIAYRLSFYFEMSQSAERGAVMRVAKSVAPQLPAEAEIDHPGAQVAAALLKWCHEGDQLPAFDFFRQRILVAGTIAELEAIGRELAGATAKLTIRELATLRELYGQAYELLSTAGDDGAPR